LPRIIAAVGRGDGGVAALVRDSAVLTSEVRQGTFGHSVLSPRTRPRLTDRSGLTPGWKIKTVIKGKFPVIGFIKDRTGVAALYLGKREGKELVYMGKVGTGWSRTVSSQIRKQLDTVVVPKSKLTKQVKKPRSTWVDRVFMADIEYRDITPEGLLRQSSFKGLSRKER
jgi:ATP dependent DNA ligase C terminal region